MNDKNSALCAVVISGIGIFGNAAYIIWKLFNDSGMFHSFVNCFLVSVIQLAFGFMFAYALNDFLRFKNVSK